MKGIASERERALSMEVPDKDLVSQSIISGSNTINAAPIIEPLTEPNPPIIIIAKKDIESCILNSSIETKFR